MTMCVYFNMLGKSLKEGMKKEEVQMKDLPNVAGSDLKSWGVTIFGPRTALQKHIKSLIKGEAQPLYICEKKKEMQKNKNRQIKNKQQTQNNNEIGEMKDNESHNDNDINAIKMGQTLNIKNQMPNNNNNNNQNEDDEMKTQEFNHSNHHKNNNNNCNNVKVTLPPQTQTQQQKQKQPPSRTVFDSKSPQQSQPWFQTQTPQSQPITQHRELTKFDW